METVQLMETLLQTHVPRCTEEGCAELEGGWGWEAEGGVGGGGWGGGSGKYSSAA